MWKDGEELVRVKPVEEVVGREFPGEDKLSNDPEVRNRGAGTGSYAWFPQSTESEEIPKPGWGEVGWRRGQRRKP